MSVKRSIKRAVRFFVWQAADAAEAPINATLTGLFASAALGGVLRLPTSCVRASRIFACAPAHAGEATLGRMMVGVCEPVASRAPGRYSRVRSRDEMSTRHPDATRLRATGCSIATRCRQACRVLDETVCGGTAGVSRSPRRWVARGKRFGARFIDAIALIFDAVAIVRTHAHPWVSEFMLRSFAGYAMHEPPTLDR
jgi:hypothetical protein